MCQYTNDELVTNALGNTFTNHINIRRGFNFTVQCNYIYVIIMLPYYRKLTLHEINANF